MANTTTALLGRFQGSSLQNAFAQANSGASPTNLDLLQIVIPGDQPGDGSVTVAVNVDHTGAVHNPASSPTNGTFLGVFESTAPNGSSPALFFSTAFDNPSLLDIIQSIQEGGNVSYYLSYAGVATGS
jgi:hypothetical protein